MSRGRAIQVILWAVIIAWTALALFLTLQNGIDTAETSSRIAKSVYQLLKRCGIIVSFPEFHLAMRKSAHFLVFGIFGVLFEVAVLVSSRHAGILRTCIPSLVVCTVLSIVPEAIKLWLPGRHLEWDEVLLNVIGAYCGVLGTFFIWKIRLH